MSLTGILHFRSNMRISWLIILSFLAFGAVEAALDQSKLRNYGFEPSLDRLEFLENVLGPHSAGGFDFAYAGSLSPKSVSLNSSYGAIPGYASRRFAGFASVPLLEDKGWGWGPVYFYERFGFSAEDFAFFTYNLDGPKEIYSNHFMGFLFRTEIHSLLFGSGLFLQNKIDALPNQLQESSAPAIRNGWWMLSGFDALGISALGDSLSFKYAQANWRWEKLYLNEKPYMYLPNIRLHWYLEKTIPKAAGHPAWIGFRQNCWQGKILFDVDIPIEEVKASRYKLHIVASPDRLIGLDLSLYQTEGRYVSGFSVRLPLFTLGYNYQPDNEMFFGSRNVFFMNFRLSLGFSDTKKFFHPLSSPVLVE